MSPFEPRAFLAELFRVAVAAADPKEAMRRHLPARPLGRTIVVGAGKAASQMASAFEELWDGPFEGTVVARHGPVAPCRTIRVLQSAHPVPDAAGLAASQALFEQVGGLGADDLVIALISGGGSALLPAPDGALTLEDEIAVNRALLESGAPISAMNAVRRQVSRIKGGGLARAAFPARVVTLVISDIPGDRPGDVASGPTVPDAASAGDALGIIADYSIALPAVVMDHVRARAAKALSPEPANADEVHVVASARVSLEAAAAAARAAGWQAVILSDAIEGEARDIGRMHAALLREIATRDRPFTRPLVMLSGGETTVTIAAGKGGRGGRNQEFLLSAALDLEGLDGVHLLAADTDGIDGSENNAGAFADGQSAARMRRAGGNPRNALFRHDSWSAFDLIGDLFVTGPTGTNVNDFRAALIL